MKTFNTDKPFIRYALLFLGVVVASLTGTISAIIFFGYLLK